jgi:hypothetical protein
MRHLMSKLFGKTRAARPKARLQLEQLDQRLLPSTTGYMSQVIDTHGNAVVFYIGKDSNLYASANDGWAVQLDNAGIDVQVSAGTDGNGNAAAFVRNNRGNSLWELHTAVSGTNIWLYEGDTYIDSNVGGFSAAMGTNPQTGKTGGVYYIGGPNSFSYAFQDGLGQVYLPSGYSDLSAGVDQFGNAVVYQTASWYDGSQWHQVLDRAFYDGGGQWNSNNIDQGIGTGYEVAGSVSGYVYELDHNVVFSYNTGNGQWTYIDGNATNIQAGTDYWWHSTVDYDRLGSTETIIKYNSASGSYTTIAQGYPVWWSAGQGGHDYYTSNFDWQTGYNQLHDRYDYWRSVWGPGGRRYWREYVADTVVGDNVAY